MGRTSSSLNLNGTAAVQFLGNWSIFSTLLDVAAMLKEEDIAREMEVARSAQKYLKPVKNIAASPEPASQPDLPQNFKNAISGVGGTDIMLVLQKSLFKTDVESNNGRLSMLFSKIQQDFLSDTERRTMENGEDKIVTIIEPSLKERKITMTQWDMKKKAGKTCSMYALKTNWNGIVRDNGLKENDSVQVWSFRVEEELRLALVLDKRAAGRRGGQQLTKQVS